MLTWSLEKIELPLKFTWRISRNSSEVKNNYIVRVKSSDIEGIGEVAFNSHYGESEESVQKAFASFLEAGPKKLGSVEDLSNILKPIVMPNSLRFGIESAFVHYLAHLVGKPVTELIGANTINQINTSFSLPIMPIGEMGKFIKDHNLKRFCALKIKVSDEEAVERIKELAKHYEGNLRIDANEAFAGPDEVLKFQEKVGHNLPIEFLEQPLPAGMHEEYAYMKDLSAIDIMADESLTDGDVGQYYQERFHSINVKLMKSGSYFKAMKQIREARELGLKVMVGCMIETSLGITSAMNIAYGVDYCDLDGSLIISKDPYNHLIEEKGKLFFSHVQ
jgi:glutamate racemase